MTRMLRIARPLTVAVAVESGRRRRPRRTGSAAAVVTTVYLAAASPACGGLSAAEETAGETIVRMGWMHPAAVYSAMAALAAAGLVVAATPSQRPRLPVGQRAALEAEAGREPATGWRR